VNGKLHALEGGDGSASPSGHFIAGEKTRSERDGQENPMVHPAAVHFTD